MKKWYRRRRNAALFLCLFKDGDLLARLQITIGVWDSGGSAVKSIQGESNSRILEITFLDSSGQPIDLTGSTPRMYVNDQFVDGTVLDATGGKAEFPVTSGMLSKPGNWPIEFLLSGPDYPPLKANGLMLKVDASHVENAVESDDKYSSLVIALNRADAAADKAEQAKTDSETAVDNANTAIGSINTKNQEITAAESARVTSENGRVTAESARVLQENARKTAETTRQSQEGTRQSQESTRQTNETARGAAETTRSQNEDTRNGNEAARKTAEQDRAAAEADRQTHEADRRNVEDVRVGAEQNRATAETARATAETARQQQETTRQTQETGRVNAESARVTAENKRETDTSTAITSANTATSNANTAATRANTAAQNAEDAISGQLDPAIDARIAAKTGVAGGIAGYDDTHTHITDSGIHVTAAQKTAWTAKADKTDIPTSLPANGGTAAKVSNALSISQGYGGQTGTYDGSAAKSISVPKITISDAEPTDTLTDGELWGVYSTS